MASVINIGFSLIALILFTSSTTAFAQATALPEGNTGIAASFPGDVNIQSSPDVLFADNFESYTSESQLTSQWSSYYHGENTRIAAEQANVFSGSRAVEFTLPQTSTEVANALVKNLSQPQDTLFVRVYTKFDSGFDVASPGHNGIRISAGNYPGPGNIPNGTNFFLFSLENSNWYNEAEPGYTHVYVYHPEQRSQWGDHWYPNGKVLPYDSQPGNFGQYFVSCSNFIPQKDRWYSYELMVKANTPGQRDGRAAIWIDGVLMADFQNLRLRDVSTLKINQIQLELHSPDSSSRVNKKWYDNVVVARSYIGPMIVGNTPPNGGSPLSTCRPYSIWSPGAVPSVGSAPDTAAVELGVKFKSDINGVITGVRFYKDSSNIGTHVGNLWSSNGQLLATATFTNETASGWQQVNFPNPVLITANTVYLVSYHTNTGHYFGDQSYFSGKGVDNPPLHALADGVSGVNGTYAYGLSSSFPDQDWYSSNYWVDVVFNPQ